MQKKLKLALPILGAAMLTMSSAFADYHEKEEKHKSAHTAVPPHKSHGSDEMAQVDIFASYILWTARMDNMTVAMDGYNQSDLCGLTGNSGDCDCAPACACLPANKLKSGFKLGIGMNTGHDNVDVMLRYTWWRRDSSKNDSCCKSCDWDNCDDCDCCDTTVHQYYSPWTNWDEVASVSLGKNNTDKGERCFDQQADPTGALSDQGDGNTMVHSAALSYWNCKYNRIDFDCGQRFFHGQYCNMRTFGGLMGYSINQNFNIRLQGNYDGTGTEQLDFQNSQKAWGIGPSAGIDGQCMFSDNWFAFVNLSASLPWSRFKTNEKHTYDHAPDTATNECDPCADSCACSTGELVYNVCYDFYTVAPVLDSSIGFGWEMNSQDEDGANVYYFMISAAWEQQVFFNHNYMQPIQNAFMANGNLSLQGFTLSFLFGF